MLVFCFTRLRIWKILHIQDVGRSMLMLMILILTPSQPIGKMWFLLFIYFVTPYICVLVTCSCRLHSTCIVSLICP